MIRILLPLLLLLALAPSLPAQGGKEIPGVTAKRNLLYTTGGNNRQRLDLFIPEKGEKMPLVVWVHGGAWQSGSKANSPAMPLTGRGFVVASIAYRFAQGAPFPAQIEDVKSAIRWLRAHAAEFKIDPDRIGAWGISAGGHLVAHLGTSGGVSEFDVGDYLEHSSAVQAVADWCGPTDILRFTGKTGKLDIDRPGSVFERLFRGPVSEKKELVEKANPINYVDATDPPFLIMHGDADEVVPISQSEYLVEALKAVGVQTDYEIVKGARHNFASPDTIERVFKFFEKTLQPTPSPE